MSKILYKNLTIILFLLSIVSLIVLFFSIDINNNPTINNLTINLLKKMGSLFFKSSHDKIAADKIPQNLWNIQIEDLQGGKQKLGDYRNNTKAYLIVNVASC